MLKHFVAILLLSIFSVAVSMAQAPSQSPDQAKLAPIDSFIKKDAVKSCGFISYYKQNKRHYLEIPDNVVGRDILVMITISKGAYRKERTGEMRFGYGGDEVFNKMIRFQYMKGHMYITQPDPMYLVDNTNINYDYLVRQTPPISHELPIVAQSNSTSLVDITDVIMADDNLFSLKGAASELKIGAAQKEYTEIKSVDAFEENINFVSQRAYTLTKPAKDELTASQWEVCSSWMLLPKVPMTPRLFDPRVGYFNYDITGLGRRTDELPRSSIAARWRLEPKEEDIARYMAGELVEPKKPIVYYIDPATPDYLIPYFIKAVNNWNEAFECAGFKNAIHAEVAPSDSSFNQGDFRYPFVSYKASPIPNAYGPHVIDPRSGEILNTHIGVYHSIGDLLQRWYFVMCSQIDERARKYPLDKDLAGRLAETVLTHEVGHTLGLRHDFMGSTAYDADSLRSSDFIRRNGLGASIMDYQRFNFIAQPGDKLSPEDLLPRIGAYDRFAIEWAYRYFPNNDYVAQAKALRQWTSAKRQSDKRLLYIEETNFSDPRVQSEDATSDDIKANTYGMKNLQYIMNHLEEWTKTDDKDYFPLRRRYLSVVSQYDNYITHIIKYIGGEYDDNCDFGEHHNVKVHVPKTKQMESLEFIDKWLIKDQPWLWRQSLMDRTGIDMYNMGISFAASKLGILLLKYTKMTTNHQKAEDLTPADLFAFLYNRIYTVKNSQSKLSYYDMMLQKEFMNSLTMNAENRVAIQFALGTEFKTILQSIKSEALAAASRTTDYIQKAHHQAIANFVTIWESESNENLTSNQ